MGSNSQRCDGENRFGMALAEMLRRRHPYHTMGLVSADLKCTAKAAENLLNGHLSGPKLSAVMAAYGAEIIVDAALLAAQTSLETFIREKASNAARERDRQEAERRRFAELQAFLISRDPPGRAEPDGSVGRVVERGR